MKHETIDAKYTILTKQFKLQHEKKHVSNLLSMSVCLKQTFMKFIEFSFRKNNFFTGKKSSGNHQRPSRIVSMYDVLTFI